MTREEAYERLTNVFRDVFDDDTLTINDATTSADVDGWDSFEHINLISAVQDEFGFRFPMGKVIAMKNVGEMVDLILQMGH